MRLEHPQNDPTRRESFLQFGRHFLAAAAVLSFDVKLATMEPVTAKAIAMPLVTVSDFSLSTQLGRSRIGSTDLMQLRHDPPILKDGRRILAKREPVYFPKFLFGVWNVTSSLRQKVEIPSCDVFGASLESTHDKFNHILVGDTSQVQFFATLANSWKNQLVVNLGTGVPESKVIANRAYNLPLELHSIGWSSIGPIELSEIEWDYRSTTAPTRVSWKDSDHRSYEWEVVDYLSEVTGDETVFAVTERHRMHELVSNSMSQNGKLKPMNVMDAETTTEYHLVSDNHVQAKTRIVVFPNPSSTMVLPSRPFCSTSMIVLDYDVIMHRRTQPFESLWNDSVEERPCVETPNGIVQCY